MADRTGALATLQAVRVRVTVVATALVLVVLAATAVAVVAVHRRTLVDGLEEALERAAADVAQTVAEDAPVPPVAGFGDDDAAFQLVAADGEVLAATENLEGAAPIAPAPTDTGAEVRTIGDLPHDEEDFLVRSEAFDAPGGPIVVHVAASLDDVDESTGALRGSLLVAVPAATAVLAGLLWGLVGRLLRRAEDAARRQQRFVADASHELRNPLTRIRTEVEVDLAHPARADPLATHRLVLDEAVGMQRLVDDLLQLARLDAGAPSRPAVAVDLDAVVARVAADLRASTGLTVDTSGVGAAQVRGDGEQLGRLVTNLADNAGRHAATTVRFEVAEGDGQVVLAVADDGPGVPPAEQARVFERFARVDAARSAGAGGTGLGLAIAREIARVHGGTIAVDPAYDGGARLVVTLPGGGG